MSDIIYYKNNMDMQYNKEIKKDALYKQCICECGGAYMNHRKLRHERTNKHQMFITNQVKETKQEYKKRYYQENKEKNKEKRSEYGKAYREVNKEKRSEYSKAYAEANKEALSEKRKAKFTCECGRTSSFVNKQRHFRTGRHQAFTHHGIDYVEMFDMNFKIWYTCWQMQNNLNEWNNLSNEYESNESHIYPFIITVKRHTF